MSQEQTPRATTAPSRKKDVDALLADFDLDISKPDTTRKPAARPRPVERKTSSGRTDDAQSLLDDLEGLVHRRRSMQKDTKEVVAPASTVSPKPVSNLRPLKMETSATSKDPSAELSTARAESNHDVSTSNVKAPLSSATSEGVPATTTATENNTTTDASSWSAWGNSTQWGSFLSTASKFAGQARNELGRRTASVIQQANVTVSKEEGTMPDQAIYGLGNKFAQRMRGFVHDAGLEQIGQNLTEAGKRGWNDIVNAVVLPVEVHDSVAVTVSHEMAGYDGIETLAFNVLSRIFSQADLDISVTLDDVNQPTEPEGTYNIHAAESRAQGLQQAKSALTRLCKEMEQGDSVTTNGVMLPEKTCPVILRIQPFYDTVLNEEDDLFSTVSQGKQRRTERSDSKAKSLFFYVWWVDPKHKLSHCTCSQAVPAWWLTVPREHNHWVEQALSDLIEGAIAVVAQDYVQSRLATFTQSTAAEDTSSLSQA